MATQHLSPQAARDSASQAVQATQDLHSAQRNVRAHQRENGHSHALWLLAVLAVTLVVGLLVSLVAPGASAVASPAAARAVALPHVVSAAVGQVDPAAPAPDAPAEPDAPEVTPPVTWGVRPAYTVHGNDRPN